MSFFRTSLGATRALPSSLTPSSITSSRHIATTSTRCIASSSSSSNNPPSNKMSNNNEQQAPGLVTGHVKLAQGIVSETIGNVTGSESWKQSGSETKQAGISELKEYQSQNPPSGEGNSTAASLESKIGSALNCDGLVKDGQATLNSDKDAAGSVPGGIGGQSLPGKSTGGADPAAGKIGDMPGNKIV